MRLRESEAIVLRSYPLGEGDRLVSFLGRSTGRLRGVARGARRPKSRFGSTLELFSHIRIWFYERETRELVRIHQCELVESFLDVQQDYAAGLALAVVSEVTQAVLPEREPADASFRLLLLTARAVRQLGSGTLPLAYFSLWTVRLGGWLPSLERCARCSRELGAEAAYIAAGHFACSKCRLPGMRALSAEALGLARRMLQEKLERIAEAKPGEAAARALTSAMLDVVEHQIERKLTTRALLESQS